MLTVAVIVGAFAVAAGAHLFTRGNVPALPPPGPPPESRSEAVRRVLKHLERKPIREIREGEGAVIVGTVVPLDAIVPVQAPMSGQPCIGYHVRIRVSIYHVFNHLQQLHDEARCVPFLIRDDTGEIVVDSRGLELAITQASTRLDLVPPHPWAVTTRVSAYSQWPLLVEEGVLVPGMRVMVCGVAKSEMSATDYRNGTSRLVISASATFPLVASSDADLFAESHRPISPEELHRR